MGRATPAPRQQLARRRAWGLRVGCWALTLALLGTVLVRSQQAPSLRVVCSSINDVCLAWTRLYSEQTGRRVAMVRMSSGEALSRLERSPGEFDVWHGGPSELYEQAALRGLLEPLQVPGAERIPAARRSARGYWVGTYRGILGFCSNRRVLDELAVAPPTRWDDLSNPRLRRAIALPDPRTSGTGNTMLWTLREVKGGQAAALDWFEGLRPNVLQFTTSGMAPATMAGRGEAAVAVTFSQHCVKAHDEGMDDLQVTYPEGPLGSELGAVAVMRQARNRAAAIDYVRVAVSAQGQLAGQDSHSRQLPARDDLPVDPRLAGPDGVAELNLDAVAMATGRDRLLDEFVRRVLR